MGLLIKMNKQFALFLSFDGIKIANLNMLKRILFSE